MIPWITFSSLVPINSPIIILILNDPVLGRGKDELKHALVVVGVALASRTHVSVNGKEGRPGEKQAVQGGELLVKSNVVVDHGDALQALETLEAVQALPLIGHQEFTSAGPLARWKYKRRLRQPCRRWSGPTFRCTSRLA